jgi:hypothetical protein
MDERDRLQVRRNEVTTALTDPVLKLYERIRSYRAGPAVAAVSDGLCTACNVRLRPQVYNEIRANDQVLTCENCSRIIYYVEPPPEVQAEGGDQAGVSA